MGEINLISECCSTINQSASSTVSQNQNVSQNNINQQETAVAIAVGEGSNARAYQIALQTNENSQSGAALAQNRGFAELCCTFYEPVSLAGVTQGWHVEQVNVNEQGTAVAIAIDGGEACAVQFSSQNNTNSQVGLAEAGNESNCPITAAEGEKKNKKEEKSNPKNEHDVFSAQAYAKTGETEKALISIDHGGQRIKIQIRQNGDVFLNNKFIMNLNKV